MEKLLVVFGKPKTFLVCCFLIFSWAAIGLFSGITLWLERIIYDSQENFFAFRRKPNPNIIIVDIDSETFESQGTSWPWPRGKLAELLNIIESGAPRFVVIDILLQFPDPYEQGKGDLALEESMKKFGNVALVSLTEENISPHGSEIRLISNLRKFRQSALLEGFVWGIVDSDSSLRSFNLSDSRLGIESCVLQIAKNLDRRFGEGFSETGESQESRIAFSKKDGGIPFLSAHDLFSGNVDPSTLKEKIVFLGVSAAILHDYHQTPLGIIPGVEILASSLDTIISKRTGAIKKELSWRLGSAILGGAFGLFIMGNLGLYTIAISIVLLLFVLVLGVFVSSYFVFFPPFAPFVLSWIFVSIIVFGIEYFFSFLETQFSKAEAKAAGNIQERFFPKEGWESPQGYSCRGICIPCEEVGGDYFDIVPLQNDFLLFLVADVCGHGFPAAMITTMAKTLTTLFSKEKEISPQVLLKAFNSVLNEFLRGKSFMTVILGYLDQNKNSVQVFFFGHPPGILVKKDGSIVEFGKPNFPVGLRKEIKLVSQEFQIEKGERLVFYTDGIVEAVNWEDKQLGFPEWKSFLSQILPNFSNETKLSGFIEFVKGHTRNRPFNDDVTILILSRD